MLFREVISLISITGTVNEIGNYIEAKSEREVFADKRSIRQNEFYQAAATGLRPEIMFVIRTIDYLGERKLSFNGKEYNIIRTYDKDNEMTELICQGIVGQGV